MQNQPISQEELS